MTNRATAVGPAVLCVVALAAGCDRSIPVLPTEPGQVPPVPVVRTLSGQVFEIVPGGRVPAPDMFILGVVVVTEGCSAPCYSRMESKWFPTVTGPDGRYRLENLPDGDAVIAIDYSRYRHVCGAGIRLGATNQLDVEITSSENPQPPPIERPLTVTGRIYEMTPSGPIGIAGASLGLDHHSTDAPFMTVYTDANGRYTACGVPPGWQMGFWAGHPDFQQTYSWHSFSGNSTVDIELKRR